MQNKEFEQPPDLDVLLLLTGDAQPLSSLFIVILLGFPWEV